MNLSGWVIAATGLSRQENWAEFALSIVVGALNCLKRCKANAAICQRSARVRAAARKIALIFANAIWISLKFGERG
jgi:hypothetical protein